MKNPVMRNVVALLSGLLFAVGLGIAGMTQPSKVLAFLDLAGDWDPSLAFVMGGAILVYVPIVRVVMARGRSVLSPRLILPTRKDLDARLVVGAGLFGVGWGLAGYCPGPALVSLTTLTGPALGFGAAMLVGMHLHARLERRMAAEAARREPTTGPSKGPSTGPSKGPAGARRAA